MSNKQEDTVDEAVELCNELLDDILALPEQAEDFASSVEETVTSIKDWIEDNQHVTEKQLKALNNIKYGIAKWHN